jgi:hypothetical protein
MLNKRGYSFGAEYPFHFENRMEHGWAVFDARNDVDHATGLREWEASKLALELNGSPTPDLAGIDETP